MFQTWPTERTMSVSGVKRTTAGRGSISVFVKLFGCRPHEGGAAHSGGRRTQTSKGGNRGKGYVGLAAGSMGICLRRAI